jgi:predicted acyl esterase
MNKHSPSTATTHRSRAGAHGGARSHGAAAHPRTFPVIAMDLDTEQAADPPFAEGAYDAIGPDLRHRMISEAAYRRYVARGYEDGYDVDDWLMAEADVDHLLLKGAEPSAGGAAD